MREPPIINVDPDGLVSLGVSLFEEALRTLRNTPEHREGYELAMLFLLDIDGPWHTYLGIQEHTVHRLIEHTLEQKYESMAAG